MPSAPAKDGQLFEPGMRVGGRFYVEALLGQGGMAAVHRVHDERTDHRLALKQLIGAAGVRSALMSSQFEREYYTLCQLAHPRIVSVYDYGVENGTPFYTMELLDGEDLSARRKLPWKEVCALLCDVASSLAIIHSRRLVHRDVSLRNVRCTSDGRAKLIDFGAMVPMGAVKQVIGTAPFCSPEALQLQALDGRSDLYALGVLAYFMLTGYYPYHARNMGQLKALWRSAPYPPRRYHRDLPPAIDSLVMELIALDRAARPGSAAEVIERLSGIAGLALTELPEVRKAYLAMPMLVGRQPALDTVNATLLQTQQGHGGSVLIEAPSGMGRSRLLDACVLEAKVQGMLVLRADAADSGDAYGLAQALYGQLFQHVPELCEESAGARRGLLGQLVPELAEQGDDAPNGPPDRRQLQIALVDILASIARAKPLVIAVDDFDKVDEASAAVLSGLADRARQVGLCLLLSVESGVLPSPALSLIRPVAVTLSLLPHNGVQTEALLRSVFGDVAHVAGLSERVHRVTEGNPSLTMTVAEQLVEQGVARYEAGSWALPADLKVEVLPQYLAGTLGRRLASLSADARELAEALSLTNPVVLQVAQYRLLTSHGDAGRVYDALDALVGGRILFAEGTHYRFGQQGLCELLQSGQDPDRARMLHARIAQALVHSEHSMQLAYHLMHGGHEREALARLLRLTAQREKLGIASFEVELAECAVQTAERLRLPLRERLAFREWLLSTTCALGLSQAVHEGSVLVAQYDRDSGLWDHRTAQAERAGEFSIAQAVDRARRRHEATAELERGLAPEEAMVHLAKVCTYLVGFAAIAGDLTLLEELPDLAPLCAQSPQLALVRLHIEMQMCVISGRYAPVVPLCHEIVRRLDQPDRAGFPIDHVNAVRFAMVYVLGLFAAGSGSPRAREWVAELQRAPGYAGNAWRVRMVYELMQGNQEAATVCQRRAELLTLQDSGETMFPGTTIRIELNAAIFADDVMGVKRLSERLEELATRYPNWQIPLCLARSHYRRLQGDLNEALQVLTPALTMARPGRHSDWSMVAATQVALLAALGRADEATQAGLVYIAQSEHTQHWAAYSHLLRIVAQAATEAKRYGEALEVMTKCIARQEQNGPRGIALGLAYEARARLAIAMLDQHALQHYFNLCAVQLEGQRDGTLSRKYEHLSEEADSVGLELVAPQAHAPLRTASGKRRAPRIATLLGEAV